MTREDDVLPRARRSSSLIVQALADETLIYDTQSNQAHCLNRAALMVHLRCDGVSRVTAVVEELAAAGQPASREVVELAVAELRAAGLLEAEVAPVRGRRSRSRRDLLKQAAVIAGVSIALPLVQSIVAPSIAEAGATCGSFSQPCCSGMCESGLMCQAGGGRGTCVPN